MFLFAHWLAGMYPAKLDPADCWILCSYLNAGSSVFRKTLNYMPKITEDVSKIVQNLYSTDAALLRIMQATLYLRAVHSVHGTRRLFYSRVHYKRIKLDGFEAANSRPITLYGTLVLFSVGQCFFNLLGVFYQSILRYSLENINNMPAVIDHFVRNISQSKMTCKLCDAEIVFRSLNEHLTSLKRHLSNKHPETVAVDGPSGSKIPKMSDFCVPKASASKFPTLSKLDRVTIAICASSHGLPFNIVEDEIFRCDFEAVEFLRGNFCTIMFSEGLMGNLTYCFQDFLGLTPEADVFLSVYGKNDPQKATQWLRCILPESRYADFEKEKKRILWYPSSWSSSQRLKFPSS